MERRQIVFFGRVQGVGFRATTREIARRHPVTGWVRNEPDGTVLAHIQGTPAAINACLDDLRRRMAGWITRETSAAISPEAEETGFEIRR
jgi:acylphosphatase